MITCINCNQQIEDDSFFCDQCGVEIKKCKKCGTLGKGKRCTQCGDIISPAKELAVPSESTTVSVNTESIQVPLKADIDSLDKTIVVPQPATANQPEKTKSLSFINKALNIQISIENNDIIGRRKGRFTDIFGNYNQVSGEHAKVHFDSANGWCITDLGSTNGTTCNGEKLTPNVAKPLKDKSFVLIANIEFYITLQ